jgi:hypothetical protein
MSHRLPFDARSLPFRLSLLYAALCLAGAAQAQGVVYRCPGVAGQPVLYTDALSSQDARDKGCRTIDSAPLTVVQARAPKPGASAASGAAGAATPGAAGARASDARVEPGVQRARDSDRRRILEDELRAEEDKLAALKRDYKDGQPERQGDERNYQRYLDRVDGMKAAIARKESDIAAIRREIGKLN